MCFPVAFSALVSYQRCTAGEHIRCIFQTADDIPVVIAINGLQGCTTFEHGGWVLQLAGIEQTEVKRFQRGTSGKHTFHILHIGCIERTNIKRFKGRTILEHSIHIRHINSIERTQI